MGNHGVLVWQLAILIILGGTATTEPIFASIAATHPIRDSIPMTQIQNIVDALIGAGDFGSWVNMLYTTDLSSLPISATFFFPSNEAFSVLSQSDLNPSLLGYHILPQRLAFSDLQSFNIGARIPTLLPNNTITITNNTVDNFTIDGSLINRPDVLNNGAIAVHGIRSIFNYTLYGSRSSDKLLGPFSGGEGTAVMVPTSPGSDAPCHCAEFPVVLSAVCAFFAFKILRYPLQ